MFRYAVLILVVVEDGLVLVFVVYVMINIAYVLILIVLEDGLVRIQRKQVAFSLYGLNPYCSGRWSRTH